MTPARRGAVDELLEPVCSRPKRTMLLPSQRRNARQPSLPSSDRRTLVRNTTTNHPRIPTTTRARIRPHQTHLWLERALEYVEELKPERTYLTHITHEVKHARDSKLLPENVEWAYDGLVVSDD